MFLSPEPLEWISACSSVINGMPWLSFGQQGFVSDSVGFREREEAGSSCLVGDSLVPSLALVAPLLLMTLSLLLLLQVNEAGSFLNLSTSFLTAARCKLIGSLFVP